MTTSGLTAVVFDADHTLLDIDPAIRTALQAVLDEMRRLSPAAERIRLADLEADAEAAFAELVAEPVPVIRRYALACSLARVGLEPELDRITELFFTHRFAATRPYPEVPALLAGLRSSYVLGYATNGNTHTRRVGLDAEFAFEIYAFANGIPKKPASGFFEAVATAAGCGPDSIVYVGDDWRNDVVGAAAAGLRTVWLNRAHLPRPDDHVTPDAEIHSLADLPTTLARLTPG